VQTGSGKTHTMIGDIEHLGDRPHDNQGMVPRVFEYPFWRIRVVRILVTLWNDEPLASVLRMYETSGESVMIDSRTRTLNSLWSVLSWKSSASNLLICLSLPLPTCWCCIFPLVLMRFAREVSLFVLHIVEIL
jgi:hypothetical protein